MLNDTDGKNPSPSDAQEATPENEQQSNNEIPSWVTDPIAAYKAIADLREENKQARIKLSEREKEEAAAKEALLVEQNQFKELAEQRATKIAELETRASEADTYKQVIGNMLESRLENAPAHIKALLVKLSPIEALTWLDENADQLAPRRAPNLDAGKTGVNADVFTLTDEQEKFVKKMGLDRDRYIANLKREAEKQ